MTDGEEDRSPLLKRTDAIEEAYEFMLAYAAQGRSGSGEGAGQIREFLEMAAGALDGLAREYADDIAGRDATKKKSYEPFLEVLDRDASSSRAAIGLVLAQATISSQMVDSLNASIHLRALLTDLFLLDEVMRPVTADAANT